MRRAESLTFNPARKYGRIDLFTNVTLSRFFFIQTKNKSHRLIYHVEFSKSTKFIRIRCKLLKIWDPKMAKFYKGMYYKGQRLTPGLHFFA